MEQRVNPFGSPFAVRVEEIDAATVEEFQAQLATAFADHLASLDAPSAPALVIDLRATSFIESKGLQALLDLNTRADEQGVRLRVLADGGPVRRTLEVAGLWERFAAEMTS